MCEIENPCDLDLDWTPDGTYYYGSMIFVPNGHTKAEMLEKREKERKLVYKKTHPIKGWIGGLMDGFTIK